MIIFLSPCALFVVVTLYAIFLVFMMLLLDAVFLLLSLLPLFQDNLLGGTWLLLFRCLSLLSSCLCGDCCKDRVYFFAQGVLGGCWIGLIAGGSSSAVVRRARKVRGLTRLRRVEDIRFRRVGWSGRQLMQLRLQEVYQLISIPLPMLLLCN